MSLKQKSRTVRTLSLINYSYPSVAKLRSEQVYQLTWPPSSEGEFKLRLNGRVLPEPEGLVEYLLSNPSRVESFAVSCHRRQEFRHEVILLLTWEKKTSLYRQVLMCSRFLLVRAFWLMLIMYEQMTLNIVHNIATDIYGNYGRIDDIIVRYYDKELNEF